MGRITLDLVRKCAEHNDGELSTLEEISLHQRDIERIDHLHRWCPRLRILLLQGNLISKIENVSRFRDLEYLNLALNNIEVVEGLESCEALIKLDFTANFITDLMSLVSLQDLPNLRELYLTGNPCTSYRGYRSWLICNLPGLEELDGTPITRSQRLNALQELTVADANVRTDQQTALEKRMQEKANCRDEMLKLKEDSMTDEEWWNSSSEHTPESRLAMHREMEERKKRNDQEENKNKKRPVTKLFTNDGRPLNVNAAKLQFDLKDDEENNSFVLDVHTYRYLDASLITCDVEPWYIRVTVKGKVLQLVLMEEIRPGQAIAQRSSATGHLVVTMPKLMPPRSHIGLQSSRDIIPLVNKEPPKVNLPSKSDSSIHDNSVSNYLEISEGQRKMDYTQIVPEHENKAGKETKGNDSYFNRKPTGCSLREVPERPDSPGFIDNDSVPPLE